MKQNGAFVSAVEPAPTPVTATSARPAPTADSVAAKWRDNLGAWIGVTVLLSAGYALLRIGLANVGMMPLPGAEHSAWSFGVFVLIGGVAFGWLMAWRSSLDERERQGEIDGMVARIEDDAEYIEQLEQHVAELRSRLDNALLELQHEQAQARATMAQARQYVPNVSVSDDPVSQRVYDDAVILTERSTRNIDYSRDKVCADLDWTTTRWYAARDLLVSCGNWQRTGKKTEVLVSNTDVALRNLAIHVGMPEISSRQSSV